MKVKRIDTTPKFKSDILKIYLSSDINKIKITLVKYII